MINEPLVAKPRKTCFVYDTRTGRVVHIHQFVPSHPDGTCSDEEMEKTALDLAPTECDLGHLAVIHRDGDGDLDPEFDFRVDCDKRELIKEPARPVTGRKAG